MRLDGRYFKDSSTVTKPVKRKGVLLYYNQCTEKYEFVDWAKVVTPYTALAMFRDTIERHEKTMYAETLKIGSTIITDPTEVSNFAYSLDMDTRTNLVCGSDLDPLSMFIELTLMVQ